MFAAIGGIFVPAGIYFAINMQGGDPAGWPIPAATDIAFALGILALLGKRVPIELKVFLTAVAIVDDLGAILIVAAFLTDKVVLLALGAAAGVIVLLSVLNRSGVRHPVPYALLGIILWLAVLKSGVHATVAGVALAATIPAGRAITLPLFVSESSDAIGLGEREDGDEMPPDTAVHRVRELANKVESPLIRWEHGLQPYVLYGVMPIFALANAGVSVGGEAASQGLGPVGWGVALGLLLGKPIGVTLGAWLGVKTGFCALPQGVSWGQIHAASWLAGIGFTMSLFISNLALTGPSATAAKLGLLLGSVLAGIIGVILLIRTCPKDVTHEVGPSLP
jgi:NhaA family Na+:H+ antiporter